MTEEEIEETGGELKIVDAKMDDDGKLDLTILLPDGRRRTYVGCFMVRWEEVEGPLRGRLPMIDVLNIGLAVDMFVDDVT